jgi:Cu2+-containing amine oxidase
LTPDEIELAVKICKQLRPGNVFASVSLYEPPKAEVLAFLPGDSFDRKVFVITHDHKKGKTYELVVNISIEDSDEPNIDSTPSLKPSRPLTLAYAHWNSLPG